MPIALTEYGRTVLKELRNVMVVAPAISGDNNAVNQRLVRNYEDRKAQALEMERQARSKGHNLRVRVEGSDRAEENKEFTDALETFVGESAICRTVDFYHWYLRSVLQLALSRDRKLIRAWNAALKLKEAKVKEIETSGIVGEALRSIFRGREGVIRNLVHQHLNVVELGTIPILVEVRNCLVHQLGHDTEGKLRDCPELGISIRSDRVVVNSGSGHLAASQVLSDTSIMDQQLGRMFGLPTSAEPIGNIRRVYVS